MATIVISSEGLSKQYRLGVINHGSLAKDLQSWWARMRRKEDPNRIIEDEGSGARPNLGDRFWALKDVSFEVEQGERLGIVGRNGAGKSTLLKILSRVTAPTAGIVRVRGRVASLLEVGTGFNPELTGRENVYLNGAILGMSRAEVRKKFDEIVDFSEVERFIDTPVKRYSSGMYVRLAFAVAAHLEPDILIVDEVLSVGDAAFQKKCLEKMHDVSRRQGRAILYVSHNMPSIVNLCERTILLVAGKKVKDGPTKDVVQSYLMTDKTRNGEVVWEDPSTAPGNGIVRLHAVRILQDGIDGPTVDVDISKEVRIQIMYWNLKEGALLYSAVWLKDQYNTFLLSSSNHKSVSLTEDLWYGRPRSVGLYECICRIPANFLNDIRYSVTAIVGKGVSETQVLMENVLSFQVLDTGAMGKEYLGLWTGPIIRPRLAWNTDFVDDNIRRSELRGTD